MLGQPISMLIPEVVGFRLTGKLPEGATATDLVLTVTQMLRQEGRGRQVCRILRPRPRPNWRSPTARRSATWRRNTARPAASSRSTPRRSAICASPAATRRASRWSRPMPRRRACGATPTRPTRCSPTCWSWTSARSSRRWPGRKRPQDRVSLSRCRGGVRQGTAAARRRHRQVAATVPVAGHELRAARRRRRDRRDHQLHQHLEPERDAGAGLRRQEGGRAGPQGQALGEDHRSRRAARWSPTIYAKAGLQTPISTRSASTWSAMAAPPASAIRGRCPTQIAEAIDRGKLAVCGGAVRQPQFRGPHPRRRCGPTIWPRRRWSSPTRWPARCRHDLTTEPLGEDNDGKPVYLRDIWPTNQEVDDDGRAAGHARDLPATLRQRVRRRRPNGSRSAAARPA